MKIHFLESEKSVEFEVHPCERVGSVALRYAKSKGMPSPPPNVVPTLRGAVRGTTLSPRSIIGEAVRAGVLMFTLDSVWSAR